MIVGSAFLCLTSVDKNLTLSDTQGKTLPQPAAALRLSVEGDTPNQRRQLRVSTACSE